MTSRLRRIDWIAVNGPKHISWGMKPVLVAALAIVLLSSAPAHATSLSITPTFDSSITGDPNAAAIEAVITQAINLYQASFSDPINVSIKFQEGGGLGGSNTTLYKISYQNFINALVADSSSANDAVALSHLPTGANNPVTGSTTINVKTANLKALGFNGASFPPIGGFDGIITLNTNLTDIGSAGTTGQYSLSAVVEHEIDEVLGLGSDLPGGGTNGFFNDPAAEDLFRYTGAGNGTRSYTTSGDDAWFSIDGTTNLARFNQGSINNNGGDYGDWWSNNGGGNGIPGSPTPQVQDAFATPGSHPTLGVELTALDAIGYNFSNTNPVPEPSTMVLFGTTLVAIARLKLRRK